MSLLMDALRRAEEEEKHQEAQADDAPETSPLEDAAAPDVGVDTSALTVQSPVAGPEDVTMQIEEAALAETSEKTHTQLEIEPLPTPEDDGDASRSIEFSDEFQLEPIDPGLLDAAAVGRDDTDTYEQVTDATGATTRGGARATSDQTSTLPSTRAVQNDLEAYFDHSQSMEIPRDEKGNVSADSTLEEVASHTLVGAQTIFTAGERPRSRRIFIAAAFIAVFIVLGIGVLGVFYGRQTPEPRYMPSPDVADGVEREAARELPVVPLEPRVADVATGLVRIGTQTPPVSVSEDVPIESPYIADRPDAVPLTDDADIEAIAALPVDVAPADTGDFPAAPAPPSPAITPTQTAIAQTPAATAQPTVGVGAGELRISRSHKPAGVDDDIRRAYDAFISDDLIAAEAAYGQALASNPDQRDALLGMGAIALRKGDLAQAYRNYATVLKRFPKDPIASAALFSLTGSDGEATAARLRVLLDAHAEMPVIHFALGNWYARRGRWGDAQLAYFDAVRLEGGNPDYNYNLAVSLDRMGQSASALDYYQKSLNLADTSGGNFNPANVLQRIGNLSNTATP